MITLPDGEYIQVTENGKTITYCTMRQKALHTIGLDSCHVGRRLYKRYGTQYYKPYRNYFCGNDSDLDRLVKAGYMNSDTEKKSHGEETTYWFNRRGLDWLGKQLDMVIRDEDK